MALWLPGKQRPDPVKFKWQFKCTQKWSDLSPTDDPNVRDCGSCNEKVHYVTSFPTFLKLVETGKCIAVDLQDAEGLFADHRQDENGPCVVAKEPPIVMNPRQEYQMPERMGRVDMVPGKDFIQKPDETRDDFGSRRMGRIVKKPKPKDETE